MAKFRAKLVKWGNSVGLSLPKPIRDGLQLEAGDEVEITDSKDEFVVKKALGKKQERKG